MDGISFELQDHLDLLAGNQIPCWTTDSDDVCRRVDAQNTPALSRAVVGRPLDQSVAELQWIEDALPPGGESDGVRCHCDGIDGTSSSHLACTAPTRGVAHVQRVRATVLVVAAQPCALQRRAHRFAVEGCHAVFPTATQHPT